MTYLLPVILLILFTWIIYRYGLSNDPGSKHLLLGWGIKVAVAVIFMLLSLYHFSGNNQPYGDVGKFYHDSKILADYGRKDPGGYLELLFGFRSNDPELLQTHLANTTIWSYGENGDLINDNRLMIRINSLIHFISFGNVWVHVLFFAFFSFIGTLLIFKAFSGFVKAKKSFFYALLITPTFSFWGSGLTKECIFVFAFGLFILHLRKLLSESLSRKSLFWLSLGICLLLVNKPFAGLVLIPMAVFPFISYRMGFERKQLLGFSSIIVIAFIISCFLPKQLNPVDRISQKQQDLINLGKGGIFFINDSAFCSFDYRYLDHFDYDEGKGLIKANKATEGQYKLFGQDEFYDFEIQPLPSEYAVYLVIPPSFSYVEVTPVNNSPLQLLLNIPQALFNVFVRPLPSDGGDRLKHLAFAENLIFIGAFICAFVYRRELTEKEKAWVFYLLASALLLVLIIGWTTPIMGAVLRYKMAPQLLLILAGFIVFKGRKTSSQ